jgi:hypothetical protein
MLLRKYIRLEHWSTKTTPVAARSKAWVYGRSLVETEGSSPGGGMDVCLL